MRVTSSSRLRLPAVTTFFNRQWWWTTLLVLVGLGVLVRLGFWQLDRREQRRAYNAEIREQLSLPPLPLTEDVLPADPVDLKNRQAIVEGEYDLSRQVALTHQHRDDYLPGFHLITPLVFAGGSRAVLVDRGWLPAAEQATENWSKYDVVEPVTVTGYIKLSQTLKNSDGTGRALEGLQPEWYRVDIAAIEAQMPYRLLPVYIQKAPSPDEGGHLPFRSALDLDLSEGNHLSYAIQWFIFATILGVGYVHYVGKRADNRQ